MQSAVVEGTRVQIGDYVWFKREYEQCGKIKGIKQGVWDIILNIAIEDDWGDEIIVTVSAGDCWIE